MLNRNAPSKIDPNMLKELDVEERYTQSISSARRQVKIDKGHTWRVRYIPAKLGPSKTFYARVAKHWLGGTPVVCPRQTGQSFGGNPDAYCPVCDLSNQLNDSENDAESKLGYQIRSTPQWLLYCVVFAKDDTDMPLNEVLIPYEHWMYKSAWDDLKNFYKSGGKKSAQSILDYEFGNDFVLIRGNKGFRLDKQESMPIFEKDAHFDEYIRKIESQVRSPKVQMPTDEQLDAFVIKVDDQVNKLRGGSSVSRRGSYSAGIEEDDDAAATAQDPVEEPEVPRRAPARPAAVARPAARTAPVAEQPSEEPVETDEPAEQAEQAEQPSKPVARPAARPAPIKPVVRPVAKAAVKPAPEPEQEVEEPETPAEQPDPESGAASDVEAEAEITPAPVRAASHKSAPAPAAQDGEDDQLPEDETPDQAPPKQMPSDGELDEAPEPAAPPAPAAGRKGTVGSSIKSKIAALKNRGV